MDKLILYTALRGLVDHPPDFRRYTPDSREHLQWLAKCATLVAHWNHSESISFVSAMNFLPLALTRDSNVGIVFGVLHRAVAALELEVPQRPSQAFGPGAVYDFLKSLRAILAGATKNLFIIDPYFDDEIFDTYLTSVSPSVSVRVLTRQHAPSLKTTLKVFCKQHGTVIEVRISQGLHDRVVFVDDTECWVLGQSIKDAARTRPTYIAPLSDDAADLKGAVYESIWAAASAL